jgi:NAD(P)H dehydrogenase (quinone)
MYAIIGVTGHVGRSVASHLQDQHVPFKAVVRNAARAEALAAEGMLSVVAELHDPRALTNAFTGVDGVFVMTPPLFDAENPLEDHTRMLEALREAIQTTTPSKIVYLSSVGAQHQHGTGAIRKLYDMEQAFQKLNISTVSIRAAWFMENFTGNIAAIRESGKLMSFISPTSKSIPMIAAKDIGKLAAQLLQEDWAGHRIVELSGPCTYSCDDVAMVLEYLMTAKVSAVPVPENEYQSAYLSFGFTQKAAALMAEMNDGFNNDHIVFEGKGCESVQGETLLEDCLKQYVL